MYHQPYKDYKPSRKQKKCKHKNFVKTEGRWLWNKLSISPDFYYNVCSDCEARGYDGLWIIERYVDSDVHDFVHGHSKEDCPGH